MLAANRLNADIPSPSLHLLGSDAGLRAQATPISALADDGHLTTSHYDRDKLLPDIPHGASPHAMANTSVARPCGQSAQYTVAHTHSRSPVNQVVRLFTASSARAILGTHTPTKAKAANPTHLNKMLHQHSNSLDRSPWHPSPNLSVMSLPGGGMEPAIPEIINISPMTSTETITIKEKPRILSLESTPPRSASIRRGPPAPIKIPNGRIHAPAIIVERDADLADLESRISVSIRAPRVPRKSTKRSKTREQPTRPAASPSASRRSSHATSVNTDGGEMMTEASNDELRFSLGFLLQPERTSVMTTRTGRADSATLPELSPFLASDSYIPPVPIIPPSLALSGVNIRRGFTNSSDESNRLKPIQRNSNVAPGLSPLASAYSQLTANSRPYNPGKTQEKRLSGGADGEEGVDDEAITDYSPTFTAASPLDSADLIGQRTSSVPLPVDVTSPAKMSPALRRVAESSSPRSATSSNRSDLDSPPIKSPGSPSHYSSTTPELSPAHNSIRPAKRLSVTTPESGSSTSQDNLSDGFEIIQRPSPARIPSRFASAEHRALPKSAVPTSAVSPGLSTGSLDGYLEGNVLENKPATKRIIFKGTPVITEASKKEEVSRRAGEEPVATFAPNHQRQPEAKPAEPRKLKFPPLEGDQFPAIIRPVNRERRTSLPSPINSASSMHDRRPSAPSPMTGAPSAIMFTPSSHQQLHAALSTYALAGSSQPSTGQKLRAIDDAGFRASGLSIRTDHIRTAPHRGLFPYTPFSQSSDTFSPAPASLGGKSELIMNVPVKAALPSAMSTAVSVKLATRARTRPPTGPRKPKKSRASSTSQQKDAPLGAGAGMPVVVESPTTTGSRGRANTSPSQVTQSPASPYPCFDTTPVRFRGLTLDVAKWTFTQEDLQELSRRAIVYSADPLAIRLLPSTVLDKDVPTELERLELLREDLKANYKYQFRRRQAAQMTLGLLLGGSDVSGTGLGATHVAKAAKLIEELQDIANKSDQISQELHVTVDQISQLRALLDNHSASALAMTLRKINASFIKTTAETADLKTQIVNLTAEREDAWALADSLERELNDTKSLLAKQDDTKVALSPPIKAPRKRAPNTVDDVPPVSSRVMAARKLSVRRSKACLRPVHAIATQSPAPFSSALYTNGSLQSSFYDSPRSGNLIPPVPPLDSAGMAQSPNTRNRLLSRRSESFAGTPLSSSKALANAQSELLQILGVPVRGMTDGGFRRTRSFSDADIRASMFPPSPPLDGGLLVPNTAGSNHRESRITSFYGAYMSRSNTSAARRKTRKCQTGNEWDMDAIYDGILDDPDTLFAVVKTGL